MGNGSGKPDGTVDPHPTQEGRSTSMVLTATQKPKAQPQKPPPEPKTSKQNQAAPQPAEPPVAKDEPEASQATSTGGEGQCRR